MATTTISEAAVFLKIRAVMLDYGEVLSFVPSPDAIARMARVFRIDPSSFLPIYIQSRGPYDRGDLLPEEYWHAFASRAGMTLGGGVVEKLRSWDIEMWSRTNAPMILWLENLRSAGVKTAILSNMPSDMVTHVRQNFPWLKHFDHQIFSADVRRIKPEPAIYEYSLKVLKVPASEVLFVDDRDANLEQARAVGIRGILFQSVNQLREELRALGLPILPPHIDPQSDS
ncbi:MAG TPA: HAD family phosphatase [Candidatus Sulfotelmatobacter sp.]|jgi:putative hydrolase of the HAD superfamily|nr:HAD family phosphatase [Candidatus Sulfotelmatobacter sp.]